MSDAPTYDVNRIPFAFMRKLLAQLSYVTMSELSTLQPSPPWGLAARIVEANRITDALKNPTRVQMLAHIIGWYNLYKEVNEALPDGELKTKGQALMTECAWISEMEANARKAQTQ